MKTLIKSSQGARRGLSRNVVIALMVVLVVGIAGVLLARGSTAGFFASITTATSTLTGNAKVVSDSSAYSGQAVVFNAPATPPPPPPPSSGGVLTCPAFPAFPDEKCTGYLHTGVTLHDCATDAIIIDVDNSTYDSCYFPKGVTIKAANVTIKRSHVHGTVDAHWSFILDYKNLALIDVEIEDAGNLNPDRAPLGGHNFSCLRCDVHHTGTGIHVGNNSTVTDSRTHDFIMTPGAHGAGMGEGQGHGNNSKIIHNNIECNRLPGQEQVCSSALSLYDEPTLDNVLVKNNLFNTVGGYCTYGGGADGTNIKYIDNYFGKKYFSICGQYGPVAAFFSKNPGNEWTGNVWADGSGPVPPKEGV